MQNRWRILAPVDLRSEAEVQVHHALKIAEALRGDLTLVHVVDGQTNRATPVEWPRNATAGHRDYDIQRLVVTGSVPVAVERCGDDLGVDLVAVTWGSCRWWQWQWPWRRSAAADIAAATDRPVWFARPAAPFLESGFRSVLCEVALDGTDDPCIWFAEDLARRCDATLVLLHVVPEASEALLAFGVPGAEDRPLSKEVAEIRMRELTSAVSHPHLTAITVGPAYQSIADFARQHDADVVIMGRRNGALSGLEADALLSRVSCPVISVPVGSRHLMRRLSTRLRLWSEHNPEPILESRLSGLRLQG